MVDRSSLPEVASISCNSVTTLRQISVYIETLLHTCGSFAHRGPDPALGADLESGLSMFHSFWLWLELKLARGTNFGAGLGFESKSTWRIYCTVGPELH